MNCLISVELSSNNCNLIEIQTLLKLTGIFTDEFRIG